jgi:hypothetical protein
MTLSTSDGKYLVYHSDYNGVSWLQGGGDTDGLQESKDAMTNITFEKIAPSSSADGTLEQLFGYLAWYSKRGYDTGKNMDSYGYMVLKTDGSNYDGASAPFWNDGFSSAFVVEEVVDPSSMYRIVSTSQNKYLTIERYNEVNN